MVHPKLLESARKEVGVGSSKERVIAALVLEGWTKRDIEGAFLEMEKRGELPQDFFSHGREQSPFPKHSFRRLGEFEREPMTGVETTFSWFRFHWTVIFVISGVVLTAVIAGTSGYIIHRASPSVVLGDALKNFSKSASFSFSGETASAVNSNFSSDVFISRAFEGIEKTTLRFGGISDTIPPSFSFFFGAGEPRFWETGVIVKNDNLYFKTRLPSGDFFLPAKRGEDLWVLLPAQAGAVERVFSTSLISFSRTMADLSSQQVSRIKKRIADISTENEITRLEDAEINGRKTYHLSFSLSREGAVRFLGDVFSIMEYPAIIGMASSGSFFDQIISGKWEMWVDKKSRTPVKIAVEMETPSQSSFFSLRRLELFLGGFNVKAEIGEPGNFLSFGEFTQKITP